MCGIAGFNWKDKGLIRTMIETISYRGPDDSGYYADDNISLGNRRLSILDLSKKGHQPMYNDNKNLIITFNGEIWNYKKIRDNLIKKGFKFKSNSDTEAVIKGYESYGEKIFTLLDGMFGLAIWDLKNKKLILARDRMGKKPIYYYFNSGKFIFGSEIKTILEEESVKREINMECLSNYLTLRYSPGDSTMFQGIKKLLPGSYLVLEKNKVRIKRYYVIPSFNEKNSPDLKEADKLISESVRKRLLSDVPIGVFLSGGLDSSAIVAYMSKFTKNIRTFSAKFKSKVDESYYAELVSKEFDTKHLEIKIDSDMLKRLPEIVWHLDEPLGDPATLPTYFLCEKVSKHVKVALSGEGGDEVFGGYDSFNSIPALKKIYKQPYLLRRFLGQIFKASSKFHRYPKKQYLMAISQIIQQKTIHKGFKELFYFPFDKDKRRILKSSKEEDSFDSLIKDENSLDIAAQKYYFQEWLPNDLLMKADKMSMAHSLEVRTPFLDADLINYFSGLSYENKRRRKLFRKIVSKMLPDAIMKKRKQGFTLPIYEWFSDKETFERILPFMEKLKERNIFSKEYIDYLITQRTNFKNEHRIWTLLNFELWFEIFIEKVHYSEIKI